MSEYSAHPDAKRLLELSDEVSRIAGDLAKLSIGTEREAQRSLSDGLAIPLEKVSAVIRWRRERARYLPDGLFADPAWDMLLDLLHAEMTSRRVSVSSVCLAAGVPPTTALRQLKILEEKGLVLRRPDPLDRRRFWIELSLEVSTAIRCWFADNLGEIDQA